MKKQETGTSIGQETIKKDQTFIVEIEYCRNASWEGTIKWTNGDRIQHFRSEMELIALIQDVFTPTNCG